MDKLLEYIKNYKVEIDKKDYKLSSRSIEEYILRILDNDSSKNMVICIRDIMEEVKSTGDSGLINMDFKSWCNITENYLIKKVEKYMDDFLIDMDTKIRAGVYTIKKLSLLSDTMVMVRFSLIKDTEGTSLMDIIDI